MRSEPKLELYRGKYCATYYENGKRFRPSLGTNDHARALIVFERYKQQVTRLEIEAASKTVAFIFERYLLDRLAEGKRSHGQIAERWVRIKAKFGHMLPDQITKQICRDYAKERREFGVSNATIIIELSYLRAAMRFGVREKFIVVEPYIPMPPKPPPRDAYLSRAQVTALIEAATTPHVRLFIILAVTTAARAGAILGLTWDRVDMAARIIRLSDSEIGQTNKGRATLPINNTAFAALENAKKGALSNFVVEWDGDRILSAKKGVVATAKRAGFKCSPHMLRHTAAVHMAEAGVAMSQIAQYLGHRNSKTTESVYARYSPDFLRGAASALEF